MHGADCSQLGLRPKPASSINKQRTRRSKIAYFAKRLYFACESLHNIHTDKSNLLDDNTGERQPMTAIKQLQERLSETEERLGKSEERLNILFELSSDWYWEQDADFRFTVIERKAATDTRFHA
jgi:PAS domain-containing protein